jgi:hypothetical protein
MPRSIKGEILDALFARFDYPDDPVAIEITTILGRVARLWTRSFDALFSKGQTYDPEDPRYIWRIGSTIEHCVDCLDMDGQSHTASEWEAAGIRPQSPDLACGGYNCDCSLVLTDEPSLGDVF